MRGEKAQENERHGGKRKSAGGMDAAAKGQRQRHPRKVEKFENPSGYVAVLALEFSPVFRVGLDFPMDIKGDGEALGTPGGSQWSFEG